MSIMNSRINVMWTGRALLLALVTCSSLSLWAATKGPDGGGYVATDEIVFSFVDISGASGGTGVLAGTDDGTAALTLPFPFTFYGTPYTTACVSTNGAIYFLASAAACTGFEADFANTDISAAPVPNDRPAVLPMWTDLTFQVPGAGSVLYQTLGTAPNRRFVVQWHNAMPQGSSMPVSFQAVLFEGGSRVLFQYKSVALTGGDPSRNGARSTVGIRNAGAPVNGQQLQWSSNAPVLADSTAIEFSTSSADTTGPAITAAATPNTVWPPNGKTVVVRVQGTIADAGSGLVASSLRYEVADEYGVVQPSGAITLESGGAFSVNVPLVADRRGNDMDGRTYTITVRASDVAGNASSLGVVVTVPHDQRK
jgi:hypothetical protein